MRDKRLPAVSFYSLWHSSASALISAGLDPVTVRRRLGHPSANTALSVYAHRFSAAADSEGSGA
jgi:integrase